jgi:hypothetical protein
LFRFDCSITNPFTIYKTFHHPLSSALILLSGQIAGKWNRLLVIILGITKWLQNLEIFKSIEQEIKKIKRLAGIIRLAWFRFLGGIDNTEEIKKLGAGPDKLALDQRCQR